MAAGANLVDGFYFAENVVSKGITSICQSSLTRDITQAGLPQHGCFRQRSLQNRWITTDDGR
jgi:hypothetical protein